MSSPNYRTPPTGTRPVTTIDSLPSETLSAIFELFLGPPPTVDLYGDRSKAATITAPLCVASLVCRRWRDPAQRVLNANLFYPRCEAWLASPSNGRLRVHSLALYERGGEVNVREMLEVLERCPRLERLYLLGEAEREISWGLFRHPSLRGLSSLVVRSLEEFQDGTDLVTPLAFHLTDLSLWLDGDDPPTTALLLAVFASSSTSLTTLSLRITAFQTSQFFSLLRLLTPAFNLVAPNLRHLTIESKAESVALDLSLCHSLQTLSFTEVFVQEDLFPNSAGFSSALRSLLPKPTLRRLSLGALPVDLLPALVPLLSLPSLALVREISLPHISEDDARETIPAEVWRRWEKRDMRVSFMNARRWE